MTNETAASNLIWSEIYYGHEWDKDLFETIDCAIHALKYRVPQKVKLGEDECLCPICKTDMMGLWDYPEVKSPAFCPTCGQALDWGGKEKGNA